VDEAISERRDEYTVKRWREGGGSIFRHVIGEGGTGRPRSRDLGGKEKSSFRGRRRQGAVLGWGQANRC